MRSPSQYSFAVAPSVQMPRSSFRSDRTYKTTFDAGYLIPVFHEEIYPGDSLSLNMTAFARLTTPIVPFMDNLHMDFHFFFVPYRLLWSHWVNMNGEQTDPDDSTDYLTPVLKAPAEGSGGFAVGSLYDYFGFPVGVEGIQPNVWLPRAYNKIWNDHFRDENLQDSVAENTGDGPDDLTDYTLLKRGKRKDYFTAALPWPQKGPGASVPLAGQIPVYGNGLSLGLTDGTNDGALAGYNTGSAAFLNSTFPGFGGDVGDTYTVNIANAFPTKLVGVTDDPEKSGLVADLSEASLITINTLREAFQIQKLWEKDARGGTRYGEMVYAHFGVINPDSRLQRSEYLGGGSIPVQIHSVAQTSSTDSTTPQGNLAAYGVTSGRVGFSKSFVEHGVVLGLVSVRADLTYQQGLRRAWSRRSRFDYYWPSLAHLGEQAILNKEIFAQGAAVKDDDGKVIDDKVFGYQERWAELRYGHSHITGKLRSGVSGSLDVWHLAQSFSNLPQLNSTFIEETPPVDRVLAVQDEPQFLFDSLATVNFVRCLPLYSVPGLVDHF